ncbi:hypothetical protein MK786_11960 [Microbacterium sp. CFH 31415]|uniref:hypothetical protein n=1 Tax=Microbacterium sp. CFH 31415 TaxID=2921732 RepID=UPI001F137817|nr:hypothetical protein [Microbacterium sp. CFH 31415]MCH6231456.1 hypothetical protein [Microbacterium sp. CFH 31415]
MALSQALLDELWDFGDPAGSEVRLRMAAEAETDAATRAELATQVARALGLQERYADAEAVLSTTPITSAEAAVRVTLERGRLRNSAGDAGAAIGLLELAAEAAASAHLTFLHVDALHMLAIADPARAAEWTACALDVLEGTTDPRTLRWTVSLHHNAGWTHQEAGRTDEAVSEFEKARDAAIRWGTPQQLRWADEALAEVRTAG